MLTPAKDAVVTIGGIQIRVSDLAQLDPKGAGAVLKNGMKLKGKVIVKK